MQNTSATYQTNSFGAYLTSKNTVSNTRINYIYGFQAQEKDDEVSGGGNSYTAEFWQYSPRLGRRWEIDPMTAKYPWQSPYAVFNNQPIYFNDPLGLEGEGWIGKKNADGSIGYTWDDEVNSEEELPPGYTHYAEPGSIHTAVNGMRVRLGSGKNDWTYLDKTEAGNYVSQEGIELQFSGEDEANFMFKQRMKGLSEALDNIKLGLGALFVAPVAIYGGIVAAPTIGSVGGFTKLTSASLLRSGLVNAGTNFLSQLATNGGSLKNVDGAGVLISGFSGAIFKSKPVFNIVSTSFLDASIDIKLSGEINYIGKKDWGEFGIEFGGGILNGAFNNGMNQYPAAFEFIGTGIINTGSSALQEGFKELYKQ